ncbi:Piso0_004773 [Millerozyma farinosa CBS 7064]|uniref:glucan endo-1,3-beta-D-glucosidase n=1 Tax=Pichia sorbitophila (strain ATCC MYA-4447 / BCRC 22081 / CBS 7064 / NBRC 10061 / NRRL Y-12695) TaxID=559304 RepID=G8Y3C3_PICSO|nr:Piso0_004773 [Millerozyma farinosa CBS 7064]
MKFSYSLLLSILSTLVSTQAGCTYDSGNYYCSETSNIVYSNVGYSGSYKDVTSMDEDTGECSQQDYQFSGNLAPLNEELSVHFRGPLKLLQFGVYYPSGSSSNKKREEAEECTTQHVHHKHKRATQVVEVTQTVVVDGNGNSITSQETATATAGNDQGSGNNNQAAAASSSTEGGAGSSAPGTSSTEGGASSSAPGTSAASSSAAASSSDSGAGSASASSSSSSASSSSSSSSGSSGDWERVAYYTPGSTDNITFFNYYGGSGSGVWSSKFGNSLSYANSDASGGSSSPVALKETTTDSDVEYIIMSSSKCSGDDCGYYRKGTPAYHGFGGDHKMFVFEFEMPHASGGSGNNYDMPAIWLLNAKIPRTLQYGDSTCSCWKSGCGELDLFEILSSNSDKLISHLHDGQGDNGSSQGGGGTQDYFSRPTSSSMKAAVVFSGSNIYLSEVQSDFGSTLDSSTVSQWTSNSGSQAQIQS